MPTEPLIPVALSDAQAGRLNQFAFELAAAWIAIVEAETERMRDDAVDRLIERLRANAAYAAAVLQGKPG